jgi:PAS domain S-box-containing protein
MFVIVGISWIIFSDALLFKVSSENILWKLAHIHILKGMLFVGVTAAFLFYVLHYYINLLKVKEEETRTLFQSSPTAMVLVDGLTLRIQEANEAAQKLFNYTPGEFKKLCINDLAHKDEVQKFESVAIFIRTGFHKLGVWRLRKNTNLVFTAELMAQPLKARERYLVTFFDLSRQLELEKELSYRRKTAAQLLDVRIQQLERNNEELAYRASQAEHVNIELISVNEQLQVVNKKIAVQAEKANERCKTVEDVLDNLGEVIWYFDLKEEGNFYISSSAEEMFEDSYDTLCRPWFWLDYVHPDDHLLKEASYRQLNETGSTSSHFRIVTKRGNVRYITERLKLFRKEDGTLCIVGSATEVPFITSFRPSAAQGKIQPSRPASDLTY